MENTKNKAVIYCRVSTKEQAEEGNSLATQERHCREYAQKNDYEIIQVFIEQGESAKTADRTELQKLLNFCADRKRGIKAIIIYKIDRLSRNTDDYSYLRISLKKYGIEIKSTSEYFENTPAGRFMENIIANVAQFDNDVRTERCAGGMRDAVREGRYVWMAPIGYINGKVNGKPNIELSDKAPLVKIAFELIASKTSSVDLIRSQLASMGFCPSKSQFYKMLHNKLYTGNISKFGEINKGVFEPIISEELFNRVEQVLRSKKTPMIYQTDNPDFPLRRFILHPKKYKLTGSWSQGRYKKYAYYRMIKAGLQWPKNDLEEGFGQFMDRYALNDSLIKEIKKQIFNRLSNNSERKAKDIESLSEVKHRLKEKQNLLLQKSLNGIINDQLLKEQLSKIDEDIWTIDKQLQQKAEKTVDIKKIIDFTSQFLTHPFETWKRMPLHTKIKLQWFQFPDGVILDGKEFRTTKISSIFKLKDENLTDQSPNVDYPRTVYRHLNSANFPPLKKKKEIVWHEIVSELQTLEAILTSKNELPDYDRAGSLTVPPE